MPGRVNDTMTRLIKEGAEFEDVIASAQDTLKSLAGALAVLPNHISQLRADSKAFDAISPAVAEKAKPLGVNRVRFLCDTVSGGAEPGGIHHTEFGGKQREGELLVWSPTFNPSRV
jgi:hypothetical protein